VVSLGANIYGKVRTLFATYTYFTTDLAGSIAKSMEVITQVRQRNLEFPVRPRRFTFSDQVSTSIFSTTKLPPSLTEVENIPVEIEGTRVQLSPAELLALKESFLGSSSAAIEATAAPDVAGTFTTAETPTDEYDEDIEGIISSKPGNAQITPGHEVRRY
jgi:hypothetical protein